MIKTRKLMEKRSKRNYEAMEEMEKVRERKRKNEIKESVTCLTKV